MITRDMKVIYCKLMLLVNFQAESNVKKIEDHRQKYEKKRKAKEQRRAELERLRKVQVPIYLSVDEKE